MKLFAILLSGVMLCVFSHAAVVAQPIDTSIAQQSNLTAKKIFYGQASFYSDKFNGRKTASGEIFSQAKMTCASNILKIGTWVKITNLRNGKTIVVKVNDRLHKSMKRIVDLTRAGARKLGFEAAGLTRVKVEVLGKKKPRD